MFDARALIDFAKATLSEAGLPDEPAASVARGLVEADLFGHTTHGLALLPTMSRRSQKAGWRREGRPSVVHERGAAATGMRAGCRASGRPSWRSRRPWSAREQLGLGAIALRRAITSPALPRSSKSRRAQGIAVLVFSSDPGESQWWRRSAA